VHVARFYPRPTTSYRVTSAMKRTSGRPVICVLMSDFLKLGGFDTATSYRVTTDAIFASGSPAASRWAGWTTGTAARPAALRRPG